MDKENFNNLFKLVRSIYKQFCLRRFLLIEFQVRGIISQGKYEGAFSHNFLFHNIILVALTREHLIGLAVLFDKDNERYPPVLSLHKFVDVNYEFKQYLPTIEKLKILRNKSLAHYDLETIKDTEKFLEDIGLKEDEIINLFDRVIDVLNNIKLNYGITQSLHDFFNNLEKKILNDFNNLNQRIINGFQSENILK